MNGKTRSGFLPKMLVGYLGKSGRIYLVRITKKMMSVQISFVPGFLILANSIRLKLKTRSMHHLHQSILAGRNDPIHSQPPRGLNRSARDM